jgi:hypothetical protein
MSGHAQLCFRGLNQVFSLIVTLNLTRNPEFLVVCRFSGLLFEKEPVDYELLTHVILLVNTLLPRLCR